MCPTSLLRFSFVGLSLVHDIGQDARMDFRSNISTRTFPLPRRFSASRTPLPLTTVALGAPPDIGITTTNEQSLGYKTAGRLVSATHRKDRGSENNCDMGEPTPPGSQCFPLYVFSFSTLGIFSLTAVLAHHIQQQSCPVPSLQNSTSKPARPIRAPYPKSRSPA